ncbi:MAG TPA: MBL fold metallo-hydrolase [Acidimicrobiia bacterium]|nr:MBL fold metallo-hydrolase [Acidimicrobiia bacterium]
MARLADRHPANVDGRWYVDTRCIDCDVARHHAPDLIAALPDGKSVVARQPATPAEELQMWRAAVACPTKSIGTTDRAPAPADVFPWELTPGVFLLGHNDRRSFGAHAWWVPRSDGGLMVDAPHWSADLVTALEARAGVADVLLTHRDDIADAAKYADHFGARVWIHEDDRDAVPFATHTITGVEPTELRPGVLVFPVPGHTRGSVLYLVDREHLFSGDSLAWSWRRDDLVAWEDVAWYSWSAQLRSLRRFADAGLPFSWVLPGHGKWHGAPPAEMHDRLVRLLDRLAGSRAS